MTLSYVYYIISKTNAFKRHLQQYCSHPSIYTSLLSPYFSINTFSNKPWFLGISSTSLLKTLQVVGKGEIVRNKQFHLFPQCFLPIWRTLCYFHPFRNCHLQTLSVWESQKVVIWERVKQDMTKFTPFSQNFKTWYMYI